MHARAHCRRVFKSVSCLRASVRVPRVKNRKLKNKTKQADVRLKGGGSDGGGGGGGGVWGGLFINKLTVIGRGCSVPAQSTVIDGR